MCNDVGGCEMIRKRKYRVVLIADGRVMSIVIETRFKWLAKVKAIWSIRKFGFEDIRVLKIWEGE